MREQQLAERESERVEREKTDRVHNQMIDEKVSVIEALREELRVVKVEREENRGVKEEEVLARIAEKEKEMETNLMEISRQLMEERKKSLDATSEQDKKIEAIKVMQEREVRELNE